MPLPHGLKATAACLFLFFFVTITHAQWIDIYPGNVTSPVNAGGHGMVQFFNADTGYAMTQKSLEKTVNGGVSWQIMDTIPFTYTSYRRMFFIGPDTGFLFMQSTTNGSLGINYTTDGGNTYTFLPVMSTGDITSAWFTSVDTGFVTTSSGDFIRTVDGGNNWHPIPIGGPQESYCVTFFGKRIGYVSSHLGQVYKTTDEGMTWNLVYNGFYPYMRYMSFPTADTGYAVNFNTPGSVMKTTDGGVTWSSTIINDYTLSSVLFTSPDTGYMMGSKIYRTTDAGAHWYGFSFPGVSFGSGISAIDNNTLFAPIGFAGTAKILNAAFSCPYAMYFSEHSQGTIDTLRTCGVSSNLTVTSSHAIPYQYAWSPGIYLSDSLSPDPVVSPLLPDDTIRYVVTLTDTIFGCPSLQDTLVVITDHSDYVFHFPYHNATTYMVFNCPGDTVLLDLGQGANSYSWSSGDTSRIIAVTDTSGYYIGTANECNVSHDLYFFVNPGICDGDVWPGDCNNDLTANNLDLLSIGLDYGKKGFSRPGASLSWTPQRCAYWDYYASPTDTKYSDCNGDGLISLDDTAAIILNYGQVHPARPIVPAATTSAIWLTADISQDTISAGQPILADLSFTGSSADSVYAVALRIDADASLIDTAFGFIDFSSSMFGRKDSNMASITKMFGTAGYLDAAVTGIDHANRNASGHAGTLTLVSNAALAASGQLTLTVSGVTAITSNGDTIPINVRGDSVYIKASPVTGIQSAESTPRIFPNPVSDELILQHVEGAESVCIRNVMGETVFERPVSGSTEHIATVRFSPGVYFITIRSREKEDIYRIIVQHP